MVGVKVSLISNPDPGPGGALLGIGELAQLTGKRPSRSGTTSRSACCPSPRGWDGRRRYHHSIVRTLAVIDTGQRAGLALDEIKTLLAASPDDGEAISRLREVAVRKLPQISALIERSQLVRDWLECAARCQCPDLDQCPLFDDLVIPAPRQRSTPLTPGQPALDQAGDPERGRAYPRHYPLV